MRFIKSLIFFAILTGYCTISINISKRQRFYAWYNSPQVPHKYSVSLRYDYKSDIDYRWHKDVGWNKEFSYSMERERAIETAKDYLISEEPTAKNIRVFSCTNIDFLY